MEGKEMPMVLTERRGSIAILTLNNPEQYNALGGSLLQELKAALDSVLADDKVRAIVLTGAGKGFCSGAQLGGKIAISIT
jgi:enoyl-CoA hydratase/carnithine racemase